MKNPIKMSVFTNISLGMPNPIGGGKGNKVQFIMVITITLVVIPDIVIPIIRYKSLKRFNSFEVNCLTIIIPNSILKMATRLYSGPVGKDPGKISNNRTVLKMESITPKTDP